MADGSPLRRTGHITFQMLGVAIGIDPATAAALPHLPTTDEAPVALLGPGDPLQVLASAMQCALDHTRLLCLHCALVGHGGRLIAVPGSSGQGKSTLTAALVQSGLTYYTDEALTIDLATGRIDGLARPLALSEVSCRVLGIDHPYRGADPGPGRGQWFGDTGELMIDPASLGTVGHRPGSVTDIVLMSRGVAPSNLVPASRGEAFAELVRRSVNHYRAPEQSFRQLAGLVRNASVWSGSYLSAPDFADLIGRTIGDAAAGSGATGGHTPASLTDGQRPADSVTAAK